MPAMTAIEMPLLRQAIADAFAILLLFVLGCYLIHRAVQRFRQLWRQHQLALAFDTSRDRKLLLRRSLQSLAETPGIQIVRKKPL